LNELEQLDLVLSAAIFGWANRLTHTLGEPRA
jgi:alkylhydroperoxidase family enzyme